MRITLLLVLFSTFQLLAGNVYSQTARLSLDMKNATVKAVLSQIEQQADFYFLYDNGLINVDRRVNIEAKNETIDVILNKLFGEGQVDATIHDRHIILSPSAKITAQQQLDVKGFVTDSSGAPLPGVTIVEKGTTNGTITNANGEYVLTDVPASAILIFSFVGMESQEVPLAGKTQLDIVMREQTIGIEEVVAVGYGTMKKSDLTGANVRADMKALENTPSVNLLQGLKGVVPGLNIGAVSTAGGSPEISIRGRNSISGSTSPLIVLDGVIYRGEFTDINPNDIESVDVLKDASSAAIYGSQGANGVILITTKKAQKAGKPIIAYDGQFTLQSLINNDMKRLDRDGFLNQIADLEIGSSRMGADLSQRNPDFDPLPFLRDVAPAGYLDGTDFDWWDALSNPTPYIQNHNLSLRGNSEYFTYFISYGYTDQENLVKNDTYKRNSFRINLDVDVAKWLKIGTQSYYSINDYSGVSPSFSSMNQLPALISPYNADGSLVTDGFYLGQTNPLLTINNPDKDIRNTLTGNFYANVSIPWVKGLSFRAVYANNNVAYKHYNFDPYAESNTGVGYKYNTNQNSETLDNIVTYVRDFGPHSINATLVYGVEKRTYENTRAEGHNYANKLLGYDFLQAGQADLNVIESDAWKETSLYTMARLMYSYKSKYIFTGTVRRDGFSGFGSNNKFGVFPSGAFAWRMSEENFMKDNVPSLDDLKLRVSYGVGGNRTVGRYATLAQVSTDGGYVFGDGSSGELAQSVGTMANNDLKWETTASTNIGLDFSFLNGRVFGSYDFYNSKTTDLIYNINIPAINGTVQTSVPTNIGELHNRGHELSITGIPVKTKDLQWTVTANFSTNKNKVNSILGIDANGDGKEDDLIASNLFIGKPIGTIYDYNLIGMWQVADYNNGIIPDGFYYGTYKVEDISGPDGTPDGNITADSDRKIIGYTDPLYRLSFQTSLKYKNFELKAFVNAVRGGKDHYLGQPVGNNDYTPDQLHNWSYLKYDYWTPENPNAKYRQLGQFTPTLGEAFSPYVSRSFVRLQELSLAYNLPKEILNQAGIANAKVYVSATNLLTFTKWDGWDPEANQGLTYRLKTPTDDSDSYSGYPTMKGFTLGLKFEF
jgi:TonB-linked SusC/RagA family outer membrane protein